MTLAKGRPIDGKERPMRIVFFSAQVIRKLAYIFVDQAARHRLLTILAIGMFMLCLPGTVWADGIPTLVQDLTPQPYQTGFSHPWHSAIASANGLLFFVAQDEVNGIELWKSDGAITNTRLIKDIYPGAPSSNPQQFTVINETLFFAADDGSTGLELWKTDGTFTGTVQVKDILPGPQGSSPKHLINVAGTLFFIVDSGSDSSELWKSDGTEAGTILVKAGFPRFLLPHLLNLSNFTAANGRLFFAAEDGNSGKELWTSDGTTSGTKLVKDIYPGPISSFPDNLTNINGMIFFITHSSTSALWKSDGTAAGTQLVQEFGRDYIDDLTVVNKTLLFICYAHNENVSLWKSDGTTNGTVLIQEFGQSYLVALTNVNDILFFFLIDSREPTLLKNGLWKSDGTTSGTVNLRAFDNRAPYSTIKIGRAHV